MNSKQTEKGLRKVLQVDVDKSFSNVCREKNYRKHILNKGVNYWSNIPIKDDYKNTIRHG